MRIAGFLPILLLAMGAFAQSQTQIEIAYAQGSVNINGHASSQTGSVLNENTLVQTEKGRAEIRFGRGDTLFLGEYSSLRVRRNAKMLSDEPEILSGAAVVITGDSGPALSCAQDVTLADAGIFRSDAID